MDELAAKTVAFISCRGRLTIMLASATRGKKGSRDGGSKVRLPDVDTERLLELNVLVCSFELAVDVVGGDIREFVNDVDGPTFL